MSGQSALFSAVPDPHPIRARADKSSHGPMECQEHQDGVFHTVPAAAISIPHGPGMDRWIRREHFE
jgi:hypothetical protein